METCIFAMYEFHLKKESNSCVIMCQTTCCFWLIHLFFFFCLKDVRMFKLSCLWTSQMGPKPQTRAHIREPIFRNWPKGTTRAKRKPTKDLSFWAALCWITVDDGRSASVFGSLCCMHSGVMLGLKHRVLKKRKQTFYNCICTGFTTNNTRRHFTHR